MNLKEIRDESYGYADDTAIDDEDKLWPKAEMNRFINRIYRRIAADTLCIKDSVSLEACQIASNPIDYTTYTVDTLDYQLANTEGSWLYQKDVAPYLYQLHSSVLKIDEVKWSSRTWKLTKVKASKWQTNPMWEQVIGMPTEYATDLQTGMIALNFRSETADTLRLVVRRLPLVALRSDTDIPEIPSKYHDFFINGVLSLMYLKQDSQCFDKNVSDTYYQAFLSDLDEIKKEDISLNQTLGANGALSAFR